MKSERTPFGVKSERNVPLQPRNTAAPVPLAASQLQLWNDRKDGMKGLGFRTCYVAMRVHGSLNVVLLQRCVDVVTERHEALRTRIALINEAPQQLIDVDPGNRLESIDLSGAPPMIANAEVVRLGTEFINEQISLAAGPLFSARLFKMSHQEHVLILALDHIITDGLSNHILTQELWSLYHQSEQGREFSLPGLELQFADYSVWQQQTHEVWLERHESYWRRRMTGAERITVPQDNGLEVKSEPFEGALAMPIGQPLTHRLRDVAQREKTLLPLVVLTIYVVLMTRWCDQGEVIVGFASHGRHRPELQRMIGFLAHVLHLRIGVSDEDSFAILLDRVRSEFRSAYVHQGFGYLPHLIPECSTEVLFNWLPGNGAGEIGGLEAQAPDRVRIEPFTPLQVRWTSTSLKLVLCFADAPGGICMMARYRADLFSASTMDSLCRTFIALADELCNDAHAPLKSACALRRG